MTYSDYMKSKNEHQFTQAPIINAEIKQEKRNEVLAEEFEYVVAHPDRQMGIFSNNGTYNLNGVDLQMTDGILKVNEKQKVQLESQGFIFLYRKEKEIE